MAGSLRKKTFRGIIWSCVENFSTTGVNFLFGIVLARLLTPADYGTLALLGVFIAVALAFVNSGFSNALVRKPDRTEADNATAFYFNIVVGLVCYGILFLAAPLIAAFYDMPILTPITRVIGLNIFLNSLCIVQQALLTAKLDFKTQAKISLTCVFVSGPVGIFCAWKGWGVWALVTQAVLAAILRTILLWGIVRWRPRAKFSRASFRYLFSYGSKLLASGLLDTIYRNITPIVIGKFFSAAQLGVYSRALHWAQLPSSQLTGVIQRVSFPVLSTIQNEDERLASNYRVFLRLAAAVIFPLLVGLSAVAEPLIRFVLTDKWIECVPLLHVICFSAMWYPIHSINLNLLQVKGRSDLFLRLEIIKKVIVTAVLCFTVPMGIMAICVGGIFTSLICLVINTHYTGKLIHLGFGRQMRDLAPTLLLSFAMGGIAYGVQLCFDNLLLRILAGTAAGALFYILAHMLLRTLEWKEMLKILKSARS